MAGLVGDPRVLAKTRLRLSARDSLGRSPDSPDSSEVGDRGILLLLLVRGAAEESRLSKDGDRSASTEGGLALGLNAMALLCLRDRRSCSLFLRRSLRVDMIALSS